jgi:hypothetical protein
VQCPSMLPAGQVARTRFIHINDETVLLGTLPMKLPLKPSQVHTDLKYYHGVSKRVGLFVVVVQY